MIKPPYLTVVWVPFLAGNLSDTRVEQLGSQDGSGSLSEEEWFDAAGEPWRFSSRCGPGSGTSLHSIVYHWNASWSFPKSWGYPSNSSKFSIFNRILHEIHHPALGVPPCMETPKWRRRNPVGWSSSWSQVEKIGYFGPARPHAWWVSLSRPLTGSLDILK